MAIENLYRMDCYFSVELISSIKCISISMSDNNKRQRPTTKMEADATRPQMNEIFLSPVQMSTLISGNFHNRP